MFCLICIVIYGSFIIIIFFYKCTNHMLGGMERNLYHGCMLFNAKNYLKTWWPLIKHGTIFTLEDAETFLLAPPLGYWQMSLAKQEFRNIYSSSSSVHIHGGGSNDLCTVMIYALCTMVEFCKNYYCDDISVWFCHNWLLEFNIFSSYRESLASFTLIF